MAFRVKGIIRLSDNGDANLGIVTANSLVGKISSEAITQQTAGDEADVTGADELLLYDTETGDLLRVTVDEFIVGAGIGTLVTDFANLDVSGITTIRDHLIVDDSNNLGTEYNFNVKTSGSSTFGVLGNGAILLGNSAAAPFIATNDHHATSKKYVDDALAGNISAGIVTATQFFVNTSGPTWTSGSGTPEGSVTAPVGSLYSRTDGGTGTTLYVKESGTGNTGWVAK